METAAGRRIFGGAALSSFRESVSALSNEPETWFSTCRDP